MLTRDEMSTSTPVLPQSHVINILKETRKHHPNFTVFLGAGASVSSGVKTANELIGDWRNTCHSMYGNGASLADYLKDQSWFNASDEYSRLFELLFDHPSQRREFIECCLECAQPSWGYIYLVNMLEKGVFNAVLTTNFDDLLNEACFQTSSRVRPIVCAHDSGIQSIRITSKRPKIVKLHGDFLFDNIKNTVREVEALEQNMRDKFQQFASEFGMIVLGYSGRDRSIMEPLEAMLHRDAYFPHGVYWAVRSQDDISPELERLSRFKKIRLFAIDGFDEFFAEVQAALEIKLQRELSDPYHALRARLNGLVGRNPNDVQSNLHPRIDADIQVISRAIVKSTGTATVPYSFDSSAPLQATSLPEDVAPLIFLAEAAVRQNKTGDAARLYVKELAQRPRFDVFARAVRLAADAKMKDAAEQLYAVYKQHPLMDTEGVHLFVDVALNFIRLGMLDEAESMLRRHRDLDDRVTAHMTSESVVHDINMAQIELRRESAGVAAERRSRLESLYKQAGNLTKLGIDIVCGRNGEAVDRFERAVAAGEIKHSDMWWPIFELLDVDSESEVGPLLAGPVSIEQFRTVRKSVAERLEKASHASVAATSGEEDSNTTKSVTEDASSVSDKQPQVIVTDSAKGSLTNDDQRQQTESPD